MLTASLDTLHRQSRHGETDIPCRVNDAELWFAETPDGVEFAKALCGACPAREDCLAGAMRRREPWGVWGGELFIQGSIVARKRPRGRPRKDPVVTGSTASATATVREESDGPTGTACPSLDSLEAAGVGQVA